MHYRCVFVDTDSYRMKSNLEVGPRCGITGNRGLLKIKINIALYAKPPDSMFICQKKRKYKSNDCLLLSTTSRIWNTLQPFLLFNKGALCAAMPLPRFSTHRWICTYRSVFRVFCNTNEEVLMCRATSHGILFSSNTCEEEIDFPSILMTKVFSLFYSIIYEILIFSEHSANAHMWKFGVQSTQVAMTTSYDGSYPCNARGRGFALQ